MDVEIVYAVVGTVKVFRPNIGKGHDRVGENVGEKRGEIRNLMLVELC